MPLSVDLRKIVKASVVPWEYEQKLYGVAYETGAGWHGADKIGTRAEAEAVLRSIGLQQSDPPSGLRLLVAGCNRPIDITSSLR